jgi:glutathione S-transferase
MNEYTLVVGDYAKSSWSMRAWLVLKTAGTPFETVRVPLEQPDTRARILRYSPSGKVPALILTDVVINDSLAIAETAAESFPQAGLWPRSATLRARARSAAAEMHSGFVSLRMQLPFGVTTGEHAGAISPDAQAEIDRLFHIWRDLRGAHGPGEFLCGGYGIVDAFFTPVVFRLRRFGIDIPTDLRPYAEAVLNHAPVREWLALAQAELRAH